MTRTVALALLIACGPAPPVQEPASSPTAIGASEALRAEERAHAQGIAGAALAQMPEADLTTEEGREVLAFSPSMVMVLTTVMMIMGGVADTPPNDCFEVERSEEGGTETIAVQADDCPGRYPTPERSTGSLVVERRQTECGDWASLTLRSWTTHSEGTCRDTDAPKGTRSFEGRLVSDSCQGLITIELVMDGDGFEEIDDECRPMRRTALSYRLRHAGEEGSRPMSGEGEVGIAGVGRAAVETIDLTIDDDCQTEAGSGTTRARAGGHVAEVRYDGATECTQPGRAPLFLDGQPAGTSEHACAAGGSGPAPFVPLLLLFALRRRR